MPTVHTSQSNERWICKYNYMKKAQNKEFLIMIDRKMIIMMHITYIKGGKGY